MDNKSIQSLIEELFRVGAALEKYRQQYSAEMVELFLSKNANFLSERIIAVVAEKFEEYATIVNSEEQPADAPIVNSEEQSATAPTVNSEEQPVTAVVCIGVPDGASVSGSSDATSDSKLSKNNQIYVSENTSNAAQNHEPLLVEPTESQSNTSVVPPVLEPKIEAQDKKHQSHAQLTAVPSMLSFKLKGGKLQAEVPYEGRIEFFEGLPGSVPIILAVEMKPDIGLQYDKTDPTRIFGIPTVGGDITLIIKFSFDATGESCIELSSQINEFVNYDPKTLWKNLPSDTKDTHWKPDFDSVLIEAGDRNIVAVSQRGRSHAHEGKFRDDDFLVKVSSTGWHIIAVADGAGSAIKSRRGSQIAVATVVDVLLELLAGAEGAKLEQSVSEWCNGKILKEQVVAEGVYPVLGIAAFKACKAIEEEAKAVGVAVKEFSTTLLVTVYKKMPLGNLFATYWVGDGGVGICLNDGTPKLLGKVDSGEYAGQTRFLDYKVMTTDEITARLNFDVVDDFRALVAMTDGITDPWFMTDNNLESKEYWQNLWVEVEPALKSNDPKASLMAWLDFWSPGNHDDRTIAILW